jgi:hypothetical protein
LSGNVTGHIAKDHRCFFMGSAHVGQLDVVVAGMIPMANVEAKVRHAAVLVAPQQYNAENSRLFARLPTRKASIRRTGWGPQNVWGSPDSALLVTRSARRNKAAGLETGGL